jgi:excisionase family DNA binding protein
MSELPVDRALIDALRRVALPDVCRVEDLAQHLRLASPTIRRLLRSGTIPGRKLGGRWFVARLDLLTSLRLGGE